MKYDQVLNSVLMQIRPADDRLKSDIEQFLKQLNDRAKKLNIKAVAVCGGSAAKNTYLKNDFDVDIFMKFENKTYRPKEKQLSKFLEKIVKPLKPALLHGSRDYFQIKKGKITYEIVPVLDIKSAKQAVNVMDMSPMHVDWVVKHTDTTLADEIRLAKQFCKANGVYGAESYIRGFSGHVLDILIIYYGSFLKLLKAATKWKPNHVIDIEKYYRGKPDINVSKISSLIVIDPVMPERNAAAAVSGEKFKLFIEAAKEFLENPSRQFFEIRHLTVKDLKGKNTVVYEITPSEGKRDIIGCKILKVYQHLKRQFRDYDIKDSGWHWNEKALIWFILEKNRLPLYFERTGPPLSNKAAVNEFKKKHKTTYTKNKQIFAKIKREYTRAQDLAKFLLKDSYVKERVRKIALKP